MRKLKLSAACLILGASIICSSCIGSFGLWNSLKDWNSNIGNKFVNEIVFFAFHIIPVYQVAYFADIIVLNSIEFWSGSNPLAENVGTVKTVKGENGEYLVRTNEDGYTITKKGEENTPLNLVYNQEKNTWNVSADGQTYELFTMNEDGTITFTQKDGTPMTVSPDLQGIISARQANSQSLFVAR
ncbi:DUF3332 domain-containing protein [uncultured Bacteroides sp.]|uniref:DUF3332 domain-containing protein n=1 Tax=uncultured Bacteroides sp. TaxID=162156 RepID=UPI00280BAC4D|nr:DUF3332 domain-containing protein [uncultured Bacteroides sp.]